MNEPMSIQEIFPGAATELPEDDEIGFPKAPLNLTLGFDLETHQIPIEHLTPSKKVLGANFVLHSAGWLEGGLCTGFEKLIMDADRLGSYQKVLSQGLDTSEDALARDAYGEVEPGGHFLGCAHTMRNYQTAFYEPKLSDSENVESWEDAGSQDMRVRANARVKQMLADYQAPPIEDSTREALDAFVAKRKEELPDAWY